MSDYFIFVLIAIIVIVGVWFIFAKVLKNKKFKYILEKCGYKQENGTNYYMAGNRSICIDINVLEYYKFII